MRKRWFWLAGLALLALPAVAMLFTNEVKWDARDFAVFGVMLFTACGAYEIARFFIASAKVRAVAGAVILTVLVALWIELAVGIFGPGLRLRRLDQFRVSLNRETDL